MRYIPPTFLEKDVERSSMANEPSLLDENSLKPASRSG